MKISGSAHGGFRPGLTQTELFCHRSELEALNFAFKKKRGCSIRVAKTKALISFAVTTKLICAFVSASCLLMTRLNLLQPMCR